MFFEKEILQITKELNEKKLERESLIKLAVKKINKKNLKFLLNKLNVQDGLAPLTFSSKDKSYLDLEILRQSQLDNSPSLILKLWGDFLRVIGLKYIEVSLNSLFIVYIILYFNNRPLDNF